MPRCRICTHDKAIEDFSVSNGYQRNVCIVCRNVQRAAARRLCSSDNVSTASSNLRVGGGDGVLDDDKHSDEAFLNLEMQLRDLTVEVRTGMANGKRLIQMEIELQRLKLSATHASDPFWSLVLTVMLTTFMFILFRWVETSIHNRRMENRQARS